MTNLSPNRRGKLTGSNVGAALGLNPWKTPEDLIRQMVREYHGAPSEFHGNVATEYGTAHEPLAIMDYFGHTGILPELCGFFVHPAMDWLGATPDSLLPGGGILEVKCPFGLRNKKGDELVFKSAMEQPHYYAQMQVEIECTPGASWADFYQWSPGGDCIERVDFDFAWWLENLPKLRAFYDWYLSELDNPAHLEDLIYEVNTLGAKSLIDEYDRLSTTIDDATARKKEVMAELVEIAKERNALLWGRKLTKVERKGSIQYTKIPELKGLDLKPYRGAAVEFWKLS